MVRCTLAWVLFWGTQTHGDVRRVIEIYEPFPYTPDGMLKQVQHAKQAVTKVRVMMYATILSRMLSLWSSPDSGKPLYRHSWPRRSRPSRRQAQAITSAPELMQAGEGGPASGIHHVGHRARWAIPGQEGETYGTCE
jgi:hypothetical protein